MEQGRALFRLPALDSGPWVVLGAEAPAHQVAQLGRLGHTGYAVLAGSEGSGALLFRDGRAVRAHWRTPAGQRAVDAAAYHQLLGLREPTDAWVQHLPAELFGSVRALFDEPESRQRLADHPIEQFKEALRALAVLGRTGAVEVEGPEGWARALLAGGRVVGTYDHSDAMIRPTLAPCGTLLHEGCSLAVFSASPAEPEPLPEPTGQPTALSESDDAIETDLVWFVSRHERVLSRLRERGSRPTDLLVALGRLANEACAWHRAVAGAQAPDLAGRLAALRTAHPIVDAFAVQGNELVIDDLLRRHDALRGDQASAFRREASQALLAYARAALAGVLAQVRDPSTAARGRDIVEALLRETAGEALGEPATAGR